MKYLTIILLCFLFSCKSGIVDDFNAANSAVKKGEYELAIELYSNVIKKNSNDFEAILYRGVAKMKMDDFVGAIADFQLVPQGAAQYFDAQFFCGDCYFRLLKYQEAINSYSKAIETKPTEAVPYYNRAIVKQTMGDNLGALFDFNKTLDLDASFVQAYFNRGRAMLAVGDFQNALADFNRLIEINPLLPSAYLHRGIAQEKTGNIDLAISDFTRAIELYPENTDAYIHRANNYVVMRLFTLAMLDYNFVLLKLPENANALSGRGIAKYFLADFGGAIEDLTAAAALDPNIADTWFYSAAAKQKFGDTPAALVDYSKAGQLGNIAAYDSIQKYQAIPK